MRPAHVLFCALAGLTSCAAVGAPPAVRNPTQVSNMTILVGERGLDKGDWEPLEDQTVFAVEFDTFSRFEAVGFEVGFAYAEDSGSVSAVDLDSEVWELYGGVRKTFSWADDHVRPYLAAGASWSTAQVDASAGGGSAELDDDAFGFYLRAGIYYAFDGGFNLGLDYRKLLGVDYSDSGVDADGDFDQLGLAIGYSF